LKEGSRLKFDAHWLKTTEVNISAFMLHLTPEPYLYWTAYTGCKFYGFWVRSILLSLSIGKHHSGALTANYNRTRLEIFFLLTVSCNY